MKPREIRAILILSEVKIKDIAAQLVVSSSAVSQVISGVRPTLRIRNAIASAINKSVDEVFPPKEKRAA